MSLSRSQGEALLRKYKKKSGQVRMNRDMSDERTANSQVSEDSAPPLTNESTLVDISTRNDVSEPPRKMRRLSIVESGNGSVTIAPAPDKATLNEIGRHEDPRTFVHRVRQAIVELGGNPDDCIEMFCTLAKKRADMTPFSKNKTFDQLADSFVALTSGTRRANEFIKHLADILSKTSDVVRFTEAFYEAMRELDNHPEFKDGISETFWWAIYRDATLSREDAKSAPRDLDKLSFNVMVDSKNEPVVSSDTVLGKRRQRPGNFQHGGKAKRYHEPKPFRPNGGTSKVFGGQPRSPKSGRKSFNRQQGTVNKTTNDSGSAKSPVVKARHKGSKQQYECLIDTGASHSLCPTQVITAMGLKVVPNDRERAFSTITGSHVHIAGTVSLELDGLLPTSTTMFAASNIGNRVIIGTDFLDRYGCIINHQKKELEIGNHAVLHFDLMEVGNILCTTNRSKPSRKNLIREIIKFDPDGCLSREQSQRVLRLMYVYERVWSFDKNDIGTKPIATCKIELTSHEPIYAAYNKRYSEFEQEIIEKEIQDGLKSGVFRRSNTNFSAPIVLVPKKGGSWRMCLDFSRLNRVTKRIEYKMPDVQESIDRLGKARYFIALDVRSAFHQIALTEDSKKYTGFRSRSGIYECNTLMFGWINSSFVFQAQMNHIFADLCNWVMIYIDDILIFASDLDVLIQKFEMVLKRLAHHNIKVNAEKSVVISRTVDYLGFKIGGGKVRSDPAKVQAIQQMKRPENLRELRSFLGAIGFLQRFIHRRSLLCSPLYDLTRKGTPFIWTKVHEDAFIGVKRALIESTELTLPDNDPRVPFFVFTDASSVGCAAILVQRQQVVAFASMKCNKHQARYSATELEAMGVYFGLRTFRPLIYGHKIHVVTDHLALSQIKLEAARGDHRYIRWLAKMAEFDYEIRHQPGVDMQAPDFLSRYFADSTPVSDDKSLRIDREIPELPDPSDAVSEASPKGEQKCVVAALTRSSRKRRSKWIEAQESDQDCQAYKSDDIGFAVIDGVIFKKKNDRSLIVVPQAWKQPILCMFHDDESAGAHRGKAATAELLGQCVWWKGWHKDVDLWCKTCILCQRSNPARFKRQGQLKPAQTERVFERVSIDITGPLQKSRRGNRYVFAACDSVSKFLITAAIPNMSARTVVDALRDKVISPFGLCESLLSDRGKCFVSKTMKEFTSAYGIQHLFTSSYAPRTNGQIERCFSTLKRMLDKCTSPDADLWDEFLPMITLSFNQVSNRSIGTSPFQVMLGREPILKQHVELGVITRPPTEGDTSPDRFAAIRNAILEKLKEERKKQKQYFDESAHKVFEHKVGDLIWLSEKESYFFMESNRYAYKGPFIITQKKSDTAFTCKFAFGRSSELPVNIDNIKPMHELNPSVYTVLNCEELERISRSNNDLFDEGSAVPRSGIGTASSSSSSSFSSSSSSAVSQPGEEPVARTTDHAIKKVLIYRTNREGQRSFFVETQDLQRQWIKASRSLSSQPFRDFFSSRALRRAATASCKGGIVVDLLQHARGHKDLDALSILQRQQVSENDTWAPRGALGTRELRSTSD